jgi:CubicO group peptidase (beta-lactamase class C family)
MSIGRRDKGPRGIGGRGWRRARIGWLGLVLFGLASAAIAQDPVPDGPTEGGDAPSAAPVVERAASAAPRDVSEILEALRATHNMPALGALVVTADGSITVEGYAGTLSRDRETRVGPEHRFHLGSCTKSMTATLAAVCVERGELAWDTTLGDAFPDQTMEPAWQAVTLLELLSHTAGAPADLSAFAGLDLWLRLDGADLTTKRRKVLAAVVAKPPIFEPGTSALYSNIGYMLAGAMLEARTGSAYETLMQARVFGPLGMTSAGFGPPAKATEPEGHSAAGKPMGELDNPAALAPAGTVHATLRDWSKYVALHLNGARLARQPEREDQWVGPLGEPAEGVFDIVDEAAAAEEPAEPAAPVDATTLSADSFRIMQTIQPGSAALGGYALGWMVLERFWSAESVLTHSGSNTMWYCVVWMAPAEDFAVLVVCNQGGPAAMRACDLAASALLKDLIAAPK